MQQQRRRSGLIIRLVALGLLAGAALTASPAQAASGVGPYLAEPAWDRKITPASRFLVLTNWNREAVLDKETGLVWERSPQTTTATWNGNSGARNICLFKNVGGRKGWRLPSIPELASLVDPSVDPNDPGPSLPPGHPFQNVQLANYWSATTSAEFPTGAWLVNFDSGLVPFGDKTASAQVWCVRGAMNADQY